MASDNNKGPGKYDKAVARATGKEGSGDDQASSAPLVPLPKEAQSMVVKPTQEMINALMADDSLEFAPQVHTLEEGEWVTGILEGKGPGTTFSQIDQVTKVEVSRHVDTWILRHPTSGLRLSVLSSVQLDDKLPPFIGAMVTIYRGEEMKTRKGFRVTNYTVAGPKRPDGRLRTWARQEAIDVPSRTIDGSTEAPRLPAGPAQTGGEDAAA